MQVLEEVCFEKVFSHWCNTKISSSTVIALEKTVPKVQRKNKKQKTNKK